MSVVYVSDLFVSITDIIESRNFRSFGNSAGKLLQ